MLIDAFLPECDVVERHHARIQAPAAQVYAVVRKLDMSGSTLIRLLFLLREFPAQFSARNKPRPGLGLDFNGLLQNGFILLGEAPPRELVLGLVGKFWTASGCIERLDPAGFRNFTAPGYAKAVWNFSLAPLPNGATRLSTETRVLCLDETSRRRFHFYWLLIRPFSGLVRMKALRAIKRQAESPEAL